MEEKVRCSHCRVFLTHGTPGQSNLLALRGKKSEPPLSPGGSCRSSQHRDAMQPAGQQTHQFLCGFEKTKKPKIEKTKIPYGR